MIPFYLPDESALEGDGAGQAKCPSSVLGRVNEERSTPCVDQKGTKAPWVGGDSAGMLGRQTSSSVCAAADNVHTGIASWLFSVAQGLCHIEWVFQGGPWDSHLDRDHSSLQDC